MNARQGKDNSVVRKATLSEPTHAPHLELPYPHTQPGESIVDLDRPLDGAFHAPPFPRGTKPVTIPDGERKQNFTARIRRMGDAKPGTEGKDDLVWIRESPSSEPWDAAVPSTLSHRVHANVSKSLEDGISSQIFDNKARNVSSEDTKPASTSFDESPDEIAIACHGLPRHLYDANGTRSPQVIPHLRRPTMLASGSRSRPINDSHSTLSIHMRPRDVENDSISPGRDQTHDTLIRGEVGPVGYDVRNSDAPFAHRPHPWCSATEFCSAYPTPINSRTNSSGFTMPSAGDDAKATDIASPVSQPTGPIQEFQRRGWRIHRLPASPSYFSHSTVHVVTDMNLRTLDSLEAVCTFLDRTTLPPPGWELWIPASPSKVSSHQVGSFPDQVWIHHDDRKVSNTFPQSDDLPLTSEEEELEMEQWYWTFIETHPAHLILPERVFSEAMDILKWSYTDTLKLSESSSSTAFTRDDCRELMGMLHSFEDRNQLTSTMRTRVVAGIFLKSCTSRLRICGDSNHRGPRYSDPRIEKVVRALLALDGDLGHVPCRITLVLLSVVFAVAAFVFLTAGQPQPRTVDI